MTRFYPIQKENLRITGGHAFRDVLPILNTALEADGVMRPDILQADMLAGPAIANITLLLSGLGGSAAGDLQTALENRDLTPILSHSATQEVWHHLRWTRGGRVIYDLSPVLAQAMWQTDVSVVGDDLVFPVPSFYIAVPPSLGLTVWNDESGEHPLDGFYVNEVVNDVCPPEQQTDPRGTLCTTKRGNTYTVPHGRDRALSVFAQGLPRAGYSLGDAAHVHLTIPLKPVPRPGGGPPVTDLEEWLVKHDAAEQQRVHGTMARIGRNHDRLWAWCRLILNTCLYLTDDNADIQARRFMTDKARAHSQTLSGHAKNKYVAAKTNKEVKYSVLGSRLRIDPNVTRETSGDQRTMQARFIVRGHWRNQAHGENRALRKRLWIQPHWKGPDWADIVARVQTVTP